jgi:hypothetical protein
MLVRFESPPPTKLDKLSKFSHRTKYILASLLLVALISAIIALNQNNGTSMKYIGEVRDVRYSAFPTPHTDVIYGLKPAPFSAPVLTGPVRDLKSTDGVYVRTATYAGDQLGVFQVGGFFFVSHEKLPFTLYPELLQWQASDIRSMSLIVHGSGTNGEYSWLNDDNYLVFWGNYHGAFEYQQYYNITWFGDVLLSYLKTS